MENSKPTTTQAVCTRCKGKGFGYWAPENGKCFGCQGKGTRAAQLQLKADAKARAAWSAAAEANEATILIYVEGGKYVNLHGSKAVYEAFGEMLVLHNGVELAPGWFAFMTRMHPDEVAAIGEAA